MQVRGCLEEPRGSISPAVTSKESQPGKQRVKHILSDTASGVIYFPCGPRGVGWGC